MKKSTLDLIKLTGFGTNLIVDAKTKSSLDLMKIISTYPKNIHLDFVNDN